MTKLWMPAAPWPWTVVELLWELPWDFAVLVLVVVAAVIGTAILATFGLCEKRWPRVAGSVELVYSDSLTTDDNMCCVAHKQCILELELDR